MIDPIAIIQEYYEPDSKLYNLLIHHSTLVAEMAQQVGQYVYQVKSIPIDLPFIYEAAILHDIGIFKTYAPSLGCYGSKPYISHGVIGRELLEEKGLYRHALVCERHVGAGISKKNIEDHNLPLPKHDMRPITLEEEIICYADKFFSKTRKNNEPKPVDEVLKEIAMYGHDKVSQFEAWRRFFSKVDDL